MTRWEESHTWWRQENHMNHNEKEHVCVAITLTLLIIRQIIAHVHNKWIVTLNRIITSVKDPKEHTKEKNKLKEKLKKDLVAQWFLETFSTAWSEREWEKKKKRNSLRTIHKAGYSAPAYCVWSHLAVKSGNICHSDNLREDVVWKDVTMGREGVKKVEAEQSKNYSQGRVLRTSILRVEPSSGQELRCLLFRQKVVHHL